MRFSELQEIIPLARYGKEKILTMSPYNGITLAMPGRHAEDTTPAGGDFVVMVDDEGMNWLRHQFTHTDIFRDTEKKYRADPELTAQLMVGYVDVVVNDTQPHIWETRGNLPGLHPQTFLYAVQCLSVAEHRRYAKHEARWGGRFLPLRYAAGIAEGNWDASQAAARQRYGRGGVEWLEKEHGKPVITQELMN